MLISFRLARAVEPLQNSSTTAQQPHAAAAGSPAFHSRDQNSQQSSSGIGAQTRATGPAPFQLLSRGQDNIPGATGSYSPQPIPRPAPVQIEGCPDKSACLARP